MSTNQNTVYFFIRADKRIYRINYNDIYYIEANKNAIIIYTLNNQFKSNISISEIEKLLPDEFFMRVHKSFIVRFDKIYYIKYPQIIIQDKMHEISIGMSYKEEFYRKIKII